MEIYVVMGTCGEYSDRQEWTVAAYDDKTLAEKHADLATTAAHLGKTQVPRYDNYGPNPYDPKMLCDYTGTDYYVLSVPFKTGLPEVAHG
jgi:hypothetical protein